VISATISEIVVFIQIRITSAKNNVGNQQNVLDRCLYDDITPFRIPKCKRCQGYWTDL